MIKRINEVYKYKSIFFDFIINIMASILLTLALQILIYPFLANKFTLYEYGKILTTMGIYNTIISTIGASLNNVRLIKNENYNREKFRGDFNRLLLIFSIISFFILYFIIFIFFKMDIIICLFLSLSVIFGIIKSYSEVTFRINLNFKNILICNCITVLGYSIGIFMVNTTRVWPLIFCIGEIFACLYIGYKNNILKEGFKKSSMHTEVCNSFYMLFITNLIASLLIYLDRLLILPFLGADNVAVYTVASFFGKSLSILMVPIAGVLLGYYSQKNFSMSIKFFWKINITVMLIGVIFYIISVIISPCITAIIYPSIVKLAIPYIKLANLTSIIGVITNIIHPSILKYAPIKWQMITQVLYGASYILFGIIMIKALGLKGFCVATIISNAIKLIILCVLGTIYINRGESNE